MTTAAVLGTGAWGTTFAQVLADAGVSVTMWGRNADTISFINGGENPTYLPGIELSGRINATTDIAEAVGRHETTVSRACTQKYLRTPFGIFELKYFFGSHVATDTGGHTASGAIRAQIEKLIQQENPHQPLTDTDLTEMLGQRGIQVARRTVAKYRESLNILPAAQRRSR